jgi:hypothetical protein
MYLCRLDIQDLAGVAEPGPERLAGGELTRHGQHRRVQPARQPLGLAQLVHHGGRGPGCLEAGQGAADELLGGPGCGGTKGVTLRQLAGGGRAFLPKARARHITAL